MLLRCQNRCPSGLFVLEPSRVVGDARGWQVFHYCQGDFGCLMLCFYVFVSLVSRLPRVVG